MQSKNRSRAGHRGRWQPVQGAARTGAQGEPVVVSIGGVTDTVSIRDLRVATVIGVYDWERETEQTLVFGVDMAADVAAAAARDDIADALDYSAVAATVRTVVTEGKFQ